MDSLRQYVISVTAVALISGILCGMLENGFGKELIKLVCGLLLTLTAIRPITVFDINTITDSLLSGKSEAAYTSAIGEKMAQEAIADIIRQETEAYILDKAAALGADIYTEVTVEGNLPTAVRMSGSVSPYVKMRLESVLEKELGITKEHQQWT